MSLTYPQFPNTAFPDGIDNINNFVDITLSALPLAKEYYEKYNSGDIAGANSILENNPNLKYSYIGASTLNPIVDAIKAIQLLYKDDIQSYLMNIVKPRGVFSDTVKYTKYNTVQYSYNSANEVYMCASNDTPIGTLPTDMTYWIPLTMRGEKGEPGVGLVAYGEWNSSITYPTNALVAYDNALWATKKQNLGITPTSSASTTWYIVMSFTSEYLTFKDSVTQKSYKHMIEDGNIYMKDVNSQERINLAKKGDINDENFIGILPIEKGGTGATTPNEALTNLGITPTIEELNYMDGVNSNVQTQLNNRATKSTLTDVTLSSSKWSGTSAPFTYTMTVNGVTTSNVIEILAQSQLTLEQANALSRAFIATGTQTTNSITLKAYGQKPSIDLPITIIVRGDL